MSAPGKFKRLFFRVALLPLVLCFCFQSSAQEVVIKGLTVENDSISALPFVYIISKKSGNGTMSDNNGRFGLVASMDDTLLCSYVGAVKTVFPVRQLHKGKDGLVRLVLRQIGVELAPVVVSTFKLRPYEREYMEDVIDRSKIDAMDLAKSPISALYMQFSREGRQVRKLARIFEQIFTDEMVQKKLNREILVKLTGDEHVDFEAFRKYCYYVDDVFVVEHEGAELYTAVMDCYRRYKQEMGAGRR